MSMCNRLSRVLSLLAACASLVCLSSAHAASAGSVQLASTAYSTSETSASVTLAVTRTGGSSGPAWVHYQSKSGTAVVDTNYAHTIGTLFWKDGDASTKTVSVKINQVSGFTGTKNFYLQLYTPTNVTLGNPSTATISLVAPSTSTGATVELSASSYTVASTGKTVTITAKRTGTGAVTTQYMTSPGTAVAGTDFTTASGTLSWASGDTSNKTFTIAVANGASSAATKNFTVALYNPTNATRGSPNWATVTISYAVSSGTSPAAALAAKLGKPSRLLIGLGSQQPSVINSQGLKVDIYNQYLSYDWPSWNAQPCDYACVVAQQADQLGAIPMLTYYEMSEQGEGNMTVLSNSAYMSTYWARLKQMYQSLAAYNKPALVHLEPDFWGFTELASSGDPTKITVLVNSNPDCSTLPNNVTGLASCMIQMARKYAPKAYLGIAYSTWGAGSDAEVVAYMTKVGAQKADFIPVETLDRDVGCFEVNPQPSYCNRPGAGVYWDESNKTHPNFQDFFASVKTYQTGLGNLPLIWWQTPMGVPSNTPGGTPYHYRDNRVHYFLTHPSELTAIGGLGVVFSAGADYQTTISTDGGQFQTLSGEYLASPVKLP